MNEAAKHAERAARRAAERVVPPPGSRAVGAVAWGKNYDPPQGAGWVTPDGRFIPAPPRHDQS